MPADRDPFGRGRSERLSDQETAERMLAAGVRRVEDEGLRVSFDLLRFEEIIVEAGVARSAVYRRWPTKHHFYADLLRNLAQRPFPVAAAYREASVTYLLEHWEGADSQLATDEGRLRMAIDICRFNARHTYQSLTSSLGWKVHLTLRATLATLPEEADLQQDLQDSLRSTEATFLTEMGELYQTFMTALGYRMQPHLPDVSPVALARAGMGVLEGLTLHDIASPEATAVWQGDPFQTGQFAEWTLPSLAFTSMMTSMFVPDPEHTGPWSPEKVAAHRVPLEQLTGAHQGAAE
ncbi:hypothetical protein [Aestuariimicrobium sp. Y1814]|uniref:hypothetical protein n=1 Tax=Aestuariimicrobium sp. Y1814 TaxID=3418742 RepID=UPI003DA70F6A